VGIIIHVDGGSRGNPGPAGAGVSIRSDTGELVHEGAYFLNTQTNNGAEYLALIRALQRVEQRRTDRVDIFSDSELLVRQITGEYRVKSPKLAKLFEQVQFLLLKTPKWSIRHIRREENCRADELANLAMDRGRDVIVYDDDPAASGETPPASPDSEEASDNEPNLAGHLASTDMKPPIVGDSEFVRSARVTLVRAPKSGGCPVGACAQDSFSVERSLPEGLCLHAAHALLPTILAILNTAPGEFDAVPTMTVRCMRPECAATFQVSPIRGVNGESGVPT